MLVTFIVPLVVFASWWNPLSWFNNWKFNKIEKVEEFQQPNVLPNLEQTQNEIISQKVEQIDSITQKITKNEETKNINNKEIKQNDNFGEIEKLKEEIEKLKQIKNIIIQVDKSIDLEEKDANKNDSENIINRPLLKSDGRLNIIEYLNNVLSVVEFISNSKKYLNKPVTIVNGEIIAFNQGNNNYIEIVDYDNSSESIELYIENNDDYSKLLDKLKTGDRLIICGFGSNSVKFTLANNGKFDIIDNNESYDSYEPTIKVDAIYRCSPTSPCQQPANANKIFQLNF